MQSYFSVKSLTHEISRTHLGPTLPVGGDFTPVPYPTVIPSRKHVFICLDHFLVRLEQFQCIARTILLLLMGGSFGAFT